jgi:4-amino-4-deoxy-L-arabinose transferase-like glycosyltransferase
MGKSGLMQWRSDTVIAAGIAFAALVPRLALAAATPPSTPIYDMADYWERAVYIAEHGRIYPDSFRMPAYPAALAAAFALGAGPSLAAARVLNAAAGAAAAVLTYVFARRTASKRAAAFAGAAVALYPSFVIYTAFIATEAVVTVPLLGCLIACTYRSGRAACVAGLCAALAALIRPAGVALVPVALLSFARTELGSGARRPDVLRPLLVVVAFVLAMTPWWVHNSHLHGRFVPFDMSGGLTIAIGNHPSASGTYRWREAGPMLARYVPGLNIWTPAGSDRAIEMAVRFMRENPGTFVRLIPAKLAALFALEGREHAYLYSWGYFGPRSPTTLQLWAAAILVSFPLLVCVSLAGFAVRGGISPGVLLPSVLFIVSTLLMHVISFGDARYHLPMVPVLAVMATGVARVANGLSRARLIAVVLTLILLAVAWSAQLRTYSSTLFKIVQPSGWNSQLSYDDLL